MKHILSTVALLAIIASATAQTESQVETIGQEINQIKEQSESGLASPNRLLNGEWTVYNLRGDKVTGEERPYITIALNEGRFYGNNGCNILNGNISVEGTDMIAFTDILSTKRLCRDAPFEYLINTTLGDVKFYTIKQYGHEYYLDLQNERRQVIMVLRQHNMDFLNGAWRVTRIDNEPNRNEGVEMVIDIPEAHIHGNTGCNIVNGDIFIDPDKPNSIQFSKLATTRMMCPDMATETAFLVALEEVETAYADGNNAAKMYDSHGREVLRLQKIDPSELKEE